MLVLDEAVLSIAQRYREDVLVVPRDQGTRMSTGGIATQPTASSSCGSMVGSVQVIGVLCPAAVCGK